VATAEEDRLSIKRNLYTLFAERWPSNRDYEYTPYLPCMPDRSLYRPVER
jgi:hypothetical protein